MKKISDNEKDIANFLNGERANAYLDIYKETDFSGKGYLVNKKLEVYKYSWNIAFGSGNFKEIYDLSKYDLKIDYKKLESFLLNDLNIVEEKYLKSNDEINRYMEVIKLKPYENEFENETLYDILEEKIKELLEDKL